MEISDLVDLLKWITPFIVAWNVWLHGKLIGCEKNIAVNEAKDNEIWDRVTTISEDIQLIMKMVSDIKEDIAYQKGKISTQ